MQRAYQRFVEILSGRPGRSELETAFDAAAHALGLPLFAYLLLPDGRSRPHLISNYPAAWTQHYLQSRYERIDPVIRLAARTSDPFEWGPQLRARGNRADCASFFDEAAQFGIRHGFTIPIQDRQRRIAAVTFATDERGPTFGRSIENYASGLHLMALFFHRHACSALDPTRVLAGAKLSPRQLECLEWAALGKSAWETSRIIGISRRTVSFLVDVVGDLEPRGKRSGFRLLRVLNV
jgi:hypothetical protein